MFLHAFMHPQIYLSGEEHDTHKYHLAEIRLIKRLTKEDKISAVSFEWEFDKYQSLLEAYDIHAPSWDFGTKTPVVHIAKKRGLDTLASDYRDTLAGHVVRALIAEDERGTLDKEKLEHLLAPLTIMGDFSGSLYASYLQNTQDIKDLSTFFLTLYDEERTTFTVNRALSYLRNKGGAVLHLPGIDHVLPLERKFRERGCDVSIINLLSIDKETP